MTAKIAIRTSFLILVLAGTPAALADSAANKTLVVDYLTLLFGEKKVQEATDRYAAENLVQHNPNVADGKTAAVAFLSGFMRENPEASWEIKRVIAEDDLVAVHTHFRRSPDDRGMAVVDIFRVADSKVAEHWDVLQPIPEKSANGNTMF